jgi:hypothetical protein
MFDNDAMPAFNLRVIDCISRSHGQGGAVPDRGCGLAEGCVGRDSVMGHDVEGIARGFLEDGLGTDCGEPERVQVTSIVVRIK